MAFALKPGRKVPQEVRRNARQQIDRALAEIESEELSVETAVHQVRKRCKKMRGLLRLVADELGDQYAQENRLYRDTARWLSDVRDAQQAVGTLASLSGVDAGDDASALAAGTRAREVLAECADRLRAGRERVAQWSLQSHGFSTLEPGLRRVYRRGRKQFKKARRSSDPQDFHQWRKVVKYHGYHLKLLRPLLPAVMRTYYRETARLGDVLGDEHDLHVLALRLEAEKAEAAGDDNEQMLSNLTRRRRELRREALRLGAHVFAEKPGQLSRRLRRHWKVAA